MSWWSRHGWILGMIAFVACVGIGFAIGFAAGRPEPVKEKPPLEVAKLTPRTTYPTSAKAVTPTPPTASKAATTLPSKVELPPMPKASPLTSPETRKVEPKKTEPKKDPEPKSTPAAKTDAPMFEKVGAVFKAKCVTCHGGVGNPKGGLDLRTLAAAQKGGDSGVAIKAGDLANSPLWDSIESGQMPPPNKEQLTADEKKLIREWILGGAK